MSAIEPNHAVFAVLTDKEQEILRLLAAGHTVKTIAVQLGRSEASINERLREARRKTSVGSSRELARLLASQKNRDENIDLVAAPAATESEPVLPLPGRSRSKGTIMMMFALPAAAAGLILVANPSLTDNGPKAVYSAAATSSSPLLGSWALDVARIPAEERPRKVTIAFSDAGEGKWAVHVEIVAADGSRQVADSVAATNGVPVKISGNMGFIDTASLRQPAPDTLVMTLGKDGAPVSTRVYTAAKDRKTMTETIVWAGQTLPGLETTYFTRVD